MGEGWRSSPVEFLQTFNEERMMLIIETMRLLTDRTYQKLPMGKNDKVIDFETDRYGEPWATILKEDTRNVSMGKEPVQQTIETRLVMTIPRTSYLESKDANEWEYIGKFFVNKTNELKYTFIKK